MILLERRIKKQPSQTIFSTASSLHTQNFLSTCISQQELPVLAYSQPNLYDYDFSSTI